MPPIDVVLYQELDKTVPILQWFDGLKSKAKAKCLVKLERLKDFGHELRRPEADYLRDGIYELRVGMDGINYRMLYFFHGKTAVVISHGLIKERIVPPREIDKALERRQNFTINPKGHTYKDR
jgi:phage-related protein